MSEPMCEKCCLPLEPVVYNRADIRDFKQFEPYGNGRYYMMIEDKYRLDLDAHEIKQWYCKRCGIEYLMVNRPVPILEETP